MTKKFSKALVSLLLSVVMAFAFGCATTDAGSAPVAKAAGESKPVVYLVGDSTVSDFDDITYYYPRKGYGTAIGKYLDTDKISVSNLALSGRSSKSFLIESNYWYLLDNIKEGDFLIIGFGHNDEKSESGRYTNPNTSIKDERSFKYSLYENYIKIALEKKATPILCTPIVRRGEGDTLSGTALHQTTGNSEYPGGDYSQSIRELADELKLTLIDNTALTQSLYEEVGPDATINFHAWTSSSKASVDNTHTNAYGAAVIAYLVAKELKTSDNPLASYVKEGITMPELSMLKSNPDYHETTYSAPTEKSSLWETTDPWLGTVFGDCGGAGKINKAYYDITEAGEVVTLRSGTDTKSAGKIASKSDGLAMYFQKIPADKDFTLSATATVKVIAVHSQVSFGLMARDAVLVDTFDSGFVSSYAAAGALKITNGAAFNPTFARTYNVDTQVTEQPGSTATVSAAPEVGSVVELKIVKTGNTYSVTYGNEPAVNYNLDLSAMDSDFIYAGLFTARQSEVDFSNINLTIK